MKHLLATIALGPLLLLQGRHVRRVTPILPEPPGARAGRVGDGPPLNLLILGDSAAAGVGAPTQDQALSGQLSARLSRRFDLRWRLLAQTGATTRDACQALDSLAPECFDVVVTSLGVNDVTGGRSPSRWIADQAHMVGRLQRDFGARQILLSALPPMHRFPALPQPLRAYLGAQALRFNAALRDWAAPRAGCAWVPLALDGDASMMASDGFHPGPPVYAAWAEQLAARITPPGDRV